MDSSTSPAGEGDDHHRRCEHLPNEIEAAIKKHDKVLDVAVVRYPHKELGEVPAAVIQPKDGHMIREEDIIDHLKALKLIGYKIPKYVEFVEKLTATSTARCAKKEIEDPVLWEGIERRG